MMRRLAWLVLPVTLIVLLFASCGASRPEVEQAPYAGRAGHLLGIRFGTIANPVIGEVFRTTNGKWKHAPTSYAYAWQRCSEAGTECANISGATSQSYTVVEADVSHKLRSKVTAKNAGGEASAYSSLTGVVGGSGELNPSLTKEDCFENPETEGTTRIEECGYPGPKNVGVENCSGLEHTSSSKTISTKGTTVENTDITGSVVVNAEDVTLKHDCVITNSEAAIKIESGGTTFLATGSTIRGETDEDGKSIQFAVESEYPEGGSLTKDHLEYCVECIHGWKWHVKETYALVNGELHNGETHREAWFDNRGWVEAEKDTLFVPETQTAIVFSENAGGGTECENEFSMERSFVAGSGQMFQNCGHGATGKSKLGKFILKKTRLARCLGTIVKGEGEYCKGAGSKPEEGFDSHGYFPHGGYFGVFGECEEKCEPAVLEWSENFWDNNLETVAK